MIGLLSDAHGNPVALHQCLEHLRRLGVDDVYFLGDAVGYLPGEIEVLRLLREAGVKCQKGNHEAMLLGERHIPAAAAETLALSGARQRLSASDLAEIAAWPSQRLLDLAGRKALLVHGSPQHPLDGYVYPDAELAPFENLPFDLVVMGNTHRPFSRQAGRVKVVNVGSCGLPRDSGDLLAFGTYDPATDGVIVYRSRLDPERVVREFGRDAIPDVVLDVLHRRTDGPVFGRVIQQ